MFPLFGLSAKITQNLAIGAIFTGVSLARSYMLSGDTTNWPSGDMRN
jgi:hypothetical protein